MATGTGLQLLQPETRGDRSCPSAALRLTLLELVFCNMEMHLLRHVCGPAYGLFWRRSHVLERNGYFVVWWSGLEMDAGLVVL